MNICRQKHAKRENTSKGGRRSVLKFIAIFIFFTLLLQTYRSAPHITVFDARHPSQFVSYEIIDQQIRHQWRLKLNVI